MARAESRAKMGYLPIDEKHYEYGVDRNIIRQMIYNGQIPARKASSIGIDFLIARKDLEKWFGVNDETD